MNEGTPKVKHPMLKMQRIYLKDLSFEQPNSPGIFLEVEPLEIEVSVNVGAEKLAEKIFESTVTVTVTSKTKGRVAFLIEVKQAGIFELHNIPPEEVDPILRVSCPGIIYPYLRANLADIITRGGFSPIHLAEIDFEELRKC